MAAKTWKCELWGGKKDGLEFSWSGEFPKFLLFSPEMNENDPERYSEGAARPHLVYKYSGRLKSVVYYVYLKRNE